MPVKYHRRCLRWVDPYLADGNVVGDLGCSYGSLTELLANHGRSLELHSCDLTPAFVEACQKRVPSTKAIITDLCALDYADNFFNAVFVVEVMEHIQEPVTAFEEIRRVLKPGGVCLITMPNRDWFHFEKYDAERRRFQPVDDHFYSVGEAEDLIKQGGLNVIQVRGGENLYFGGGIPHLCEKIALRLYPKLHRRMKRMMILCQKPFG